jgi:hypothetical protein
MKTMTPMAEMEWPPLSRPRFRALSEVRRFVIAILSERSAVEDTMRHALPPYAGKVYPSQFPVSPPRILSDFNRENFRIK